MSSAEQTVPAVAKSASSRLGRPVLTTYEGVAQSLAVGPIFSSVIVAYLIAGVAGGAAPLATLIGAIGVLALGWVITLYARRRGYVGAGGIYDFIRQVSPRWGLFSAAIYFLGALLLDAAGFLIIGFLSTQILQNYLGVNVPLWVCAVVGVLLLFALNHLGIRLTTRVQLTLTALSALPLLLLAGVIISKGGDAGNTLQAFNPTLVPFSALFGGVLFAILLFVGFELSASLGEEFADPRRSIPRAIIFVVLITAVFYLVVIYATDIGLGLNHTDKWDLAALDTLSVRYVGRWLAILVDIAVLFDALAVQSAFMAAVARGCFALSRHGLLPSPLARMSSRYRTPLGGNLAVLIAGLLVIVATAVSQIDPATVFTNMATIGSLLIEAIYIVLCVFAIRFLMEEPAKWWRWLFLLVATVTPILAIYGNVVPFPAWPSSLAIYCALAGIVIALAWTLYIGFRHPERLADASQPHAWEVEEEGEIALAN